MKRIIISGPAKLKGSVQVQGAKNSAMKHIFIPMISEGKFTLNNIPKIGSVDKHVDLIKLFGAEVLVKENNSYIINTENIRYSKIIPKELIYYTSGGNHLIPIITSRFGKCEIQIDSDRSDYGGDQIGSRKFDDIIKTLKFCGITSKLTKTSILFNLKSTSPINFNVPVGSFTATVLALFSSLFKHGKSTISNYTKVHEFEDILEFLTKAGAKITKYQDRLEVFGPTKLINTTYKNMNDPHDFVTWLFAGLATDSNITINGCEYEKMKLQTLEKVLRQMNFKGDLKKNAVEILPQLHKLKAANLIAGQYPLFTTEWQVLISPLLTQITGSSSITETFYTNRMQHWNEMRKMGIKFNLIKHQRFPKLKGSQQSVDVLGSQKFKSAKVNARDVRTGAALIIGGLLAKGLTEITNAENIYRGYEDVVGRLTSLGVNIKQT